MNYLENIRFSYGRVKLIDGRIITCHHISHIPGSSAEIIRKTDLTRAFGVVRKGYGGRTHAVVLEGYLFTPEGSLDPYFYFEGCNSFHIGCSNTINKYHMRLTHPSYSITCSRCLKKIQNSYV